MISSFLQSTPNSMASNKNNGGTGGHNYLSSSSSLLDGSPYRHTYFSSRQDSGKAGNANAYKMLPPIGFAVFAIIMWLLCCRVLRTYTEEQEATGGGDDETTVRQLQSNEAGDGLAPPVADVEMAPPLWKAEPPLVCTYRKADGWREGSCGVCLAELDDGEDVRVMPACMHYFHAACVGEWLCAHETCPLCRAPLVVAPANAT